MNRAREVSRRFRAARSSTVAAVALAAVARLPLLWMVRPAAGAQSARGRTRRDHTMLDGTRMACRGGREAGTSGRTRILPEAAGKRKCTHTPEIRSRVSPARRRAHSFSPDDRAAAASMGTLELYSQGTIGRPLYCYASCASLLTILFLASAQNFGSRAPGENISESRRAEKFRPPAGRRAPWGAGRGGRGGPGGLKMPFLTPVRRFSPRKGGVYYAHGGLMEPSGHQGDADAPSFYRRKLFGCAITGGAKIITFYPSM